VKLASVLWSRGLGIAVVEEDSLVDVVAANPSLPSDMRVLLAMGNGGRELVEEACKNAPRYPLDFSKLMPPVLDPPHFFGVGLNYRDHAREVGRELKGVPAVFAKLPESVNRPFGSVIRPGFSDTLDYEGELGIVIGQRCHAISAVEARGVIAGYVVVNDFSIREYVNPSHLALGKGYSGHGPFGPWITTSDEVCDPHDLRISTWVNGDLRQDSSTSLMATGCYDLVEFISRFVTLQPGDIISTGSPAGSAAGFEKPKYLKPGDKVRVEIEKLGYIENLIVRSGGA
jgi:2-keto-4-pentenoate hydratase/2-oxohepta-3-ene-1,7-dioic acid hydratase in catechol pathway